MHGDKKTLPRMCLKGIKSEKPSGNSPSSKAVGEQGYFNFQVRDEGRGSGIMVA